MRFVRLLAYLLVALAGLYVLATVLYAIPMIAGLLDDRMEVRFSPPNPSLVAGYGNGLEPQQKETYYHLSQGSEIVPWILLTAVDVADPGSARPFVENLERYGLLPDPARADNLPVGLTVSSNPFTFGMDFVGITCAACHVSELRYGGKAVRVDGAPNMFNMQLFYSQAVDALMAATTDRGKLWHALKRLGRQDYERYGIAAPFVRPATLVYYGASVLRHRDRLDARLELIAVIRAAKEQRDPEHPTSGFGRLDAFDGTRNFLFTRLRKADAPGSFQVNKANMVNLDAAVKFPPLWSGKNSPPEPVEANGEQPQRFPAVLGFKDYDWVEWTMNTNTVMERNVTETLGAGATVVLDPARSSSLFESSIPIENMHQLEWLAYYIDPPQWPTEVFGEIKPNLAAAGRTIFENRCAGCHEYGPGQRSQTGLIRLRGMRPETVGTDPTVALRISCPVPDTGALAIAPRSYSAEESELLKDCVGVKAGVAFEGSPFAGTVQVAVDGIKQKAYAAAGIDGPQQRMMEDLNRRGNVTWRDTLLDTKAPYGPYAARPLRGIWAAAPFLHNGSVPTLYHLLLPPEQRPKQFALGGREYDPMKLGFAVTTECSEQDCLVDTTRTGDRNGGHLWATDLTDPDRMALLEYLKTY
ncbi:mono/diheme cytochrome c family protein [Rhizobium mesoamericanum]|uniref:di-heme-cytochrome C peroxidase n=1 Tax=Rhizobium mesoamericanum TaxID=1079800 RepID=UPI0027890CCE|nr:di-heme-cytochrome C peroxidase [Rhizobium mesoamericanum]MDQ0563244.1 mono/diheme cytochrome c family protein [Rhizobium mesoamericanum]